MTRRTTWGGTIALSLVATLAISGCSSDDDAGNDTAPEDTASSSSVAPDVPPTSALTGLDLAVEVAAGPLLVVKIDNTYGSRPQVGLGSADLVVEELVEGGSTRLAAFFQSSYPADVGPVRSIRATDIGIVPAADDTLIVTSGAAPDTIRRVNDAGLSYVEEGAPGFYRDSQRSMPYNLFADGEEIAAGIESDAQRPADYLPWGESEAYASGAGASSIDVRFSPGHTTQWSLDGEQYVIDNGFAASGDEYRADTVVTIEVDVVDAGYRDPAGNPVPESVFEGSGSATVFHGGRAVEATWSKESESSPVQLETADGAALTVPPGRAWIELVPSDTGSVQFG